MASIMCLTYFKMTIEFRKYKQNINFHDEEKHQKKKEIKNFLRGHNYREFSVLATVLFYF